MLALTELRELSTLDDEVETLLELVLRVARVTSTLEEDSDRLNDDVIFAEMLALTELRELSTLDDEFEIARELAFVEARAASMLEDEFDKLALEV